MNFCVVFTIVVCVAWYALIGYFHYGAAQEVTMAKLKQAANPEVYTALSKIKSIICGVFWPVFSTYNACLHVFILDRKKEL